MVAHLSHADRGVRVTVDLGPDPRLGCSICDHLGGPPYRVYSTGARTLRGVDPAVFTVVDWPAITETASGPWQCHELTSRCFESRC